MNAGPELNPVDVGHRIRGARRLAHLPQAELGRRVGVCAGPMNNIERGRSLPSTRVLAAIARELGMPIETLLWGHLHRAGENPAGARPAAVRDGSAAYAGAPDILGGMRVMRPAEIAGRPEARARLEAVAGAYLALEDICGVMKSATLPLSLPFSSSVAGIGELVSRVRALLGIGDAVIFDYLELIENAGLRVVFVDLPADIESVGCHDEANANALIFLRDVMNPERHLFRMLCELGWIYGHVQRRGAAGAVPRDGRETELDDEHAARRFAALFLMPESAVRATVRQLGIRPNEWTYALLLRIKHRFGVSAQSFNLRLLELNLITTPLQAELRRRIEAHYAATGYGEPDASRRILSPNGRLGDLLLCAREHHPVSEVDQIAATLRGLPGMPGEEPA